MYIKLLSQILKSSSRIEGILTYTTPFLAEIVIYLAIMEATFESIVVQFKNKKLTSIIEGAAVATIPDKRSILRYY